jgi:hypothetical protein
MKCPLCERDVSKLFGHHLKPKKSDELLYLCKDCATQMHAFFTRLEMRQKYNSLEKLKASPKVQEYLNWVRDKPIMNLHPTMKD